jgi:hypothetical protein
MNSRVQDCKAVHLGISLALCSVLFSFVLGASFGVFEERIKHNLAASAGKVFDTVYGSDMDRKNAVVSKSWVYLQRAHLHAGAIGATALGGIACVLVASGSAPGMLISFASLFWGAGGLLYGIFWLCAGFEAPALGSTALAKESFMVIGISGAASSIMGVVASLAHVIMKTVRVVECNECSMK